MDENDTGLFYEIDYDASPIEGVGKFIARTRKITPQENSEGRISIHSPVSINAHTKADGSRDEIRELFYAMREISRKYRTNIGYSNYFSSKMQRNNAQIFYKQGVFMKDFTDDYEGNEPCSAYYPNYQMMGYEQLRTYFTWRTAVRKGNILATALSYAFIYIYELINNIGVENPQEGLDRLMSFWKAFREYDRTIDKYVIKWLKDYHIYYGLQQPFKEFAAENGLLQHYPKLVDSSSDFELYRGMSNYDIGKSVFFIENNKLVTDCWYFVLNRIKEAFIGKGLSFDSFMFAPVKKMSVWQPFESALFYPWMGQLDRQVVLSENEIYVCSHNNWRWNTVLTVGSGRQFVGYIMKQMESGLRRAVKYKHKLTANINSVGVLVKEELDRADLSLESLVDAAVLEYYKEATKIVVTVDDSMLSKIREEALLTQERLMVEENAGMRPRQTFKLPQEQASEQTVERDARIAEKDSILPQGQASEQTVERDARIAEKDSILAQELASEQTVERDARIAEKDSILPQGQASEQEEKRDKQNVRAEDGSESELKEDIWARLKKLLSEVETAALKLLLAGDTGIKKFADENGIMLEVLIDGINEKAVDTIGDGIVDEEMAVYEDYIEDVKELIG